jgi:ubiquinone/menaquinone biosynthesis C-methylase UbiE
MQEQDHFWSRVAASYEREFVDPFCKDVRGNPLKRILRRLGDPKNTIVADLGCGIGPLLPFLSKYYKTVHAVDFAEGMLDRAREQVKGRTNVRFHQAGFNDLSVLPEPLDVAVAVNSLVLPKPADIERALTEIGRHLKPNGHFLGIVPAMDAVHYYTMLLVDRAVKMGKPIDAARKNAGHHCEHEYYDFAFGQFRFRGLHQHFWQPFEIRYRFERTGFILKRLKKVHLSWKQFAGGKELQNYPAPWDWFFLAIPKEDKSENAEPAR